MVSCGINGCIVAGKKRKLLSGNSVLCTDHYNELLEIVFLEECDEGQINSDSVASALAQIKINMEANPIKSILPKLEKDDDDLFFGTGLKI